MALSLTVDGKTQSVEVDPSTPLLYVLRDELKLDSPPLSAAASLQCGACTVRAPDGKPVRAPA